MIVLEALFPIFGLLVLGGLLKFMGLTNEAYLKTSDKLVYYIFFPIMLFYKIGSAPHGEGNQLIFALVTLLVLSLMFVISSAVIRWGPVTAYQAGSFSQSCYRFNTYIGVAVILNSLGEEGISYLGLMIALAIPLINVFAVATLIWNSGSEADFGRKGRILIRALVANPLIIGCFFGLGYARLVGGFPQFIDNSLQLMSMVTLPLALISIGGSLSFTGIKTHLPLAFLGAGLKLAVLPLLGLMFYHLFQIEGVAFKTGMIFLCLPASTAIYVLSSQLNSDTELASAAIVVSTVLSFVSLSIALLI
ncbi:MAG: AEC family transporter [Desulfocapsaceae bacterium]